MSLDVACEYTTHQPTCVIKSYVGKHTCVKLVRNRQANSSWVSDYFLQTLKTNPLLKPQQMMNELWSKFGITVTLMMCRRSRSMALEKIWGSLESHYMKLTPYLTELRNRDKEGRFELKTYMNADNRPIFQRVYIGFSAFCNGFFIGCRKFIGFDACFLKTVLGGALLAAVSKDCNNKMYPVAEGSCGKRERGDVDLVLREII